MEDRIRRPRNDFSGRVLVRLRELERVVGQVAPREASDLTVSSTGFPGNPRLHQQVFRTDLSPSGWYSWDGENWSLVS